jgi:excisionase family DNA binding protein
MADQAFLRVRDVQTLLGISRDKAYRMIKAGTLPSVRVGGSIRIPVAELTAYLAENFTPAAEPIPAPAA